MCRRDRAGDTVRKDFAPSEKLAIVDAVLAIEKKKAKDRRIEGNRPGGKQKNSEVGGNLPETSDDEAGEANAKLKDLEITYSDSSRRA